tara:strand:+ start:3111 stop:4997 length:1887 start_codon:yes stop_codon:yes gene_type:complete
MAIDYGISTALSGFFGSGDKKAIRQQEMQTLMQMNQQMENQKNQELKLGMEMEQFISSADDVARKIIMQQGIREEDRKYIQDLAASERSSIEENIKKHGSMIKYLRAGGYKDLMNYKRSILGSDKMAELESNAAVYSKILQAKETTPDQIFQRDLDNLKLYQEGKIDNLTYSGLMSKMDMEGLADEYGKDQEITDDMILNYSNNRNIVLQNISREYGYATEDITEDMMVSWVSQRYGSTARGGVPMHGKQDIKASPANDLITSLRTTKTKFADFDDGTGTKMADEFMSGASVIWKTKLGHDPGTKTEWKRGMRPTSGGRVVTNPALERMILETTFTGGDKGSIKWKGNKKKVYGVKSAGLFLHNGSEISPDETGFWHMEGDVAPTLHYQGMFVGYKGEGKNLKTNRWESFLITDIKDEKKRAEMQELYGNVEVSPVLIAELRDSDLIRDDLYYKEIPVHTDYFRSELNKTADINTELAAERNLGIDTHHKIKDRTAENKRIMQSNDKIAKAYGDGSPESVMTLMDSFGSPLQQRMEMTGIPNHMYPLLMAEMMESIDPKSKDPGTELLNNIVNFSQFALHPNNTEWLEVLRGGNIANYYALMETNNYDLAKRIKKSASIWADVLKTEE